MDKDKLIEKLQNYNYYVTRLTEIREQLAGITEKVTPTYGNLAGSFGSGISNKVQASGIKYYELHKKEEVYKKKINTIVKLIECSGLDEREKAVMWWIAKNGKLAAYARRENIGKDNVYKIRDRAVKKILLAIKLQSKA